MRRRIVPGAVLLLLLLLLLLASVSTPMHAQARTAALASWHPDSLEAGPAPGAATVPRIRTGNYRWEAAAVGAVVFGAAGAWLGANAAAACPAAPGACHHDSVGNAVLAGALGAASGGVTGFLFGLLLPKYAPLPARPAP